MYAGKCACLTFQSLCASATPLCSYQTPSLRTSTKCPWTPPSSSLPMSSTIGETKAKHSWARRCKAIKSPAFLSLDRGLLQSTGRHISAEVKKVIHNNDEQICSRKCFCRLPVCTFVDTYFKAKYASAKSSEAFKSHAFISLNHGLLSFERGAPYVDWGGLQKIKVKMAASSFQDVFTTCVHIGEHGFLASKCFFCNQTFFICEILK